MSSVSANATAAVAMGRGVSLTSISVRVLSGVAYCVSGLLVLAILSPIGISLWGGITTSRAMGTASEVGPGWQQQAGKTVFSPFPEKTNYFGDPTKQWMINFRVSDLDKLAGQLEAAGIAVKVDPTIYPNGRFAHIHDPEGNPIELWQPKAS